MGGAFSPEWQWESSPWLHFLGVKARVLSEAGKLGS